MPNLTNRSRLSPGPAPVTPPWRWLDPRTVQKWLRVSAQTLVNWRARGTGPAYRIAENRRVWYRAADVQAWIDEMPPERTQDAIRAYLREHEELWVLLGYGPNFPSAMRGRALALLVKASKDLGTLTSEELEELCSMIDLGGRTDLPPKRQRPKRFIENAKERQFIGYV